MASPAALRLLRRHSILCFVVATFSIQAALGWLGTEGHIRRGFFEWSFLVKPGAAIALVWLLDGKPGLQQITRPLTRWRAHPGWYVFATVVFPIILVISVYTHRALTGRLDEGVRFDWWVFREPHWKMYTVIAAISLADEVAYFGFVYTRLAPRFTGLAASLIVALCWSVSYMPRILLQSEMMADATIPPLLFVGNFVTLSPICAWVYGSAKSGFLVSLMQITTNFGVLVVPVLPATAGTPDVFLIKVLLMGLVSAYLVHRFGARYLTVSGRPPPLGT